MQLITNKLIRIFKPCYDPSKYLSDSYSGNIVDFLKQEQIPAKDRLWVVLRKELLEEKKLRLFSVKVARFAINLVKDKNLANQLTGYVDVAERFALGNATEGERENAYAAAAAAYAAATAYATAYAAAATAYATAYAAAAAAYAAATAAANAAYAATATADATAASAAYAAAYAYATAHTTFINFLLELVEQDVCAGNILNFTGVKHDQEKPDMSLLSSIAMLKVAQVMTFGKKKYSANNWRGGIKYTRLLAACLRHVFAYLGGESKDPETGLSHIAHGICCLMMILEFEDTKPELDDRYRPEAKDESSKK